MIFNNKDKNLIIYKYLYKYIYSKFFYIIINYKQ